MPVIYKCIGSLVIWLTTARLWVRLPADPLPGNNPGQVVHTRVPLSPSSIFWYRLNRREGFDLPGFCREAVYGRGVAYRPYNWAVFAAHCRLKASKQRWAPSPRVIELWESVLTLLFTFYLQMPDIDTSNAFHNLQVTLPICWTLQKLSYSKESWMLASRLIRSFCSGAVHVSYNLVILPQLQSN